MIAVAKDTDPVGLSMPDPSALASQRDRAGSLRCPHCECVGRVRSSESVTPQHRKLYYQCGNVLCGHSWLATVSYEYGLSPSAIPNPKVTLPLRPVPRQQVMELLRERDPSQPDMFDVKTPDAVAPDSGCG